MGDHADLLLARFRENDLGWLAMQRSQSSRISSSIGAKLARPWRSKFDPFTHIGNLLRFELPTWWHLQVVISMDQRLHEKTFIGSLWDQNRATFSAAEGSVSCGQSQAAFTTVKAVTLVAVVLKHRLDRFLV